MFPYVYKIISVDRVVDGDTVDLTLDIGFSIKFKHRFRMTGYDAPETWRPKNENEKVAGKRVTILLEGLLNKYKNDLFVCSTKLGIYGRYNAEIFTINENKKIIINDEILKLMVENKLTKNDVKN